MTRRFRIMAGAIFALAAARQSFPEPFAFPSELQNALSALRAPRSPGLYRPTYRDEATPIAGRSGGNGAPGAAIGLLPASVFASWNDAFPAGDSDGALWQGRGASGLARAGAEISWGWGRARFVPEWWIAQNMDYSKALYRGATATDGDYAAGLDRLQAYGSGAHHEIGFGQSELRLGVGGLTLGFGTETFKLGPAETQNLLMSGNASGFPHLDLGTEGPYSTRFGSFEARFFWGRTETSEWYAPDPSTGRLLTGGALGYSPPFLEGMSFGFMRVFHSPWDTMNAWKVFQFFDDTVWKSMRGAYSGASGDDDVDQILSFTWEWRIPERRSRIYVEWGRNDHASDLKDFLMQPEHSMGYVAGLQAAFPIGEAASVLVEAEIADVGDTIGSKLRPTYSWYRHGVVPGGYTQRGQLLGAPMGPGSNAQELNVSYSARGWFVGLGARRLNMDTDYFYSTGQAWKLYDLWMTGTLRFGVALGPCELGAALGYTYNWDRNFIAHNDVGNWHVELGAKYSRR